MIVMILNFLIFVTELFRLQKSRKLEFLMIIRRKHQDTQ